MRVRRVNGDREGDQDDAVQVTGAGFQKKEQMVRGAEKQLNPTTK